MKWLQGRDTETATARKRKPDLQVLEQRSLALGVLCQRLRPDIRYSVLDLGTASGRNVDFFASFCGKIYIEDLFDTLSAFDYLSPEDGVSYDSVFQYLLPYQSKTRFDLIFSWDLLNYLDRPEAFHLMKHLSQFCRKGSIHFMLVSSNRLIPESPGRYQIADTQTLSCQIRTDINRPGPQYSEADLAALMPGFHPCNSFLMRNGMKEYLMVFDG